MALLLRSALSSAVLNKMSIPKHIWSGIYRSFSEVPKGDVFNSARWLNRLNSSVPEPTKLDFPGPLVTNDYLLPIVAALGSKSSNISILDFGGGLGNIVSLIDATIPDTKGFEFHIIDLPSICAQGAKRFERDPRVAFHTALPEIETATIVHLASSLQYIDDWENLLARLAQYKPIYMIFTDLPAGEIETFVTAQHYYGDLIPVRFWNFSEFCRAVEKLGFKLAYASRYGKTYLSQTGELPTDNFPESHRLRWACQMLFSAL